MGILTVGVVTKPFLFEGSRRMKAAEAGLEEMQKYVDTLIVIPNQNLFRIVNEKTTFVSAFAMADDVLHDAVRSVTDLIVMPGLINLDFADIRTVMKEMGKAMMGTGEADGEDRALCAAEAAISNPLLDIPSMKGAKGVIINITGGSDMTLFEIDKVASYIKEVVGGDANIIVGSAFNENLEGKIRVSVVATGIDHQVESVFHNSNIDVEKASVDAVIRQTRDDGASYLQSNDKGMWRNEAMHRNDKVQYNDHIKSEQSDDYPSNNDNSVPFNNEQGTSEQMKVDDWEDRLKGNMVNTKISLSLFEDGDAEDTTFEGDFSDRKDVTYTAVNRQADSEWAASKNIDFENMRVNAGVQSNEDDDGALDNNNEKKREFFDIPAFLRKKVGGKK